MLRAPAAARARAGLLVVAGMLGALLVGVAAWNHVGVRARAQALSLGEGQLMVEAVGLAIGRAAEPGHPPSSEDLGRALDALAGLGLVWIAIVDGFPPAVLAEAGAPRAPRELLPPPDEEAVFLGETVRFAASPRMPPPGYHGGPPPRVVVEFAPQAAPDLLRRSRTALIASSLGAVLLWGAALWLWRLSARAEAAEREMARHRHLASLGQVSALLAHEIKNPLAALKGHAQLLARKVEPEQRERAERVVGEAKRLEDLVASLLDFARTAAVERALVDPLALLREVLPEATGEAPPWGLDPLRMRQVLANLVDNARQASPDDVEASVAVQEGALVFTVRDRGPGFDPATLDRVFEPFFTTRARGTGLGLALVRRVVTLHGGTVAVANRADGGAEVVVRIPRSA